MKTWLCEHPYFSTSVVFVIIIILGWQFLYWQWENFAFLLLLYFIVTLGIRLDDISRKIGFISNKPSHSSGEKESIIRQLNDIRFSIRSLDATLKKIVESADKKDTQS